MSEIGELRYFHTERRERCVTVTCEKSPVPMLWLDSSVLIDLAKIDNKESIDRLRAKKLSTLKELARCLVRAEKLVCPEWDQSLEFEGKRLDISSCEDLRPTWGGLFFTGAHGSECQATDEVALRPIRA
jgi:hypothetical protein